MNLITSYSLVLGNNVLTVNVNLGFTYGFWSSSQMNDPYVDANIELHSIISGIFVNLGTEQQIGNTLDFLNAPSFLIESNSGLFLDEYYLSLINGELENNIEGGWDLVIEIEKNKLERIKINESLINEFSELKKLILSDLNKLFSSNDLIGFIKND